MLTTFNTPFGRYRFLRVPFGVHSVQDVFQKMVDKTYGDLQGVAAIIDDLLVYGKTKEEHYNNLRAFLQQSRERRVTLNPDKLIYRTEAESYFSNWITSEGVEPDPSTISPITDMPSPENKAQLQTLLGMVNYLPSSEVKQAVTNSETLPHFDPQKKVELEVDASKNGLGAAMFQDGKPMLSLPSRCLSGKELRSN